MRSSRFNFEMHEGTLRRKFSCDALCRKQGESSSPPVLYGLDCEMCETAVDSRALVRVCVVDEDGKDVLDVSSSHRCPVSL